MALSRALTRILLNRNVIVIAIVTLGLLPVLIYNGGYFIMEDVSLQMIPFVYETKRMLASGSLLWSWNTYFGDNFYADYAYYTLFNPFTWFNCLFPYKYIPLGFTITLYLKFLLCAYLSQLYFRKMGYGDKLSLIGALLYTFSSWAITSLMFFVFLDPMMVFPLLLVFIERFLRKQRYRCFGLIMCVFLVIVVNYYFAVCTFIAASLYYLFRAPHFDKGSREITVNIAKALGCVSVGIMMSMIILVPVVLQLMGSPRFESTGCWDFTHIANRFVGLVFPKYHEGPFGYLFIGDNCKNNAASIALFGMLPLFIMLKHKRNWMVWLTLLYVVLYLTPLTGIFALFTDYYYTRWAYALSLTFCLCTLYCLKNYGMPTLRQALWYSAAIFALYLLFALPALGWYTANTSFTEVRGIRILLHGALILLNLGCLIYLAKKYRASWQNAVVIAVALCVTAQMSLFFQYFRGGSIISNPVYLSERDYYINGQTMRSDDDFTYRHDFFVDEEGRHFANLGLICNMPSVQTYHSMQNNRLQALYHTATDNTLSVFNPEKHRRSFDALMSVKQVIHYTKTHRKGDLPLDALTPAGSEGMFDIYDFAHYIPMGFTYDTYLAFDDVKAVLEAGNDSDVPLNLLNALCIMPDDEAELSQYLTRTAYSDSLALDSVVAQRRTHTCDYFKGDTHGFTAHITLPEDKVVFFSVVADPGFTATIDGNPTRIYEVNLGMSAIVVPEGEHTIVFDYTTPGLKAGAMLTLIALLIAGVIFVLEYRHKIR